MTFRQPLKSCPRYSLQVSRKEGILADLIK